MSSSLLDYLNIPPHLMKFVTRPLRHIITGNMTGALVMTFNGKEYREDFALSPAEARATGRADLYSARVNLALERIQRETDKVVRELDPFLYLEPNERKL